MPIAAVAFMKLRREMLRLPVRAAALDFDIDFASSLAFVRALRRV